MSWSSKSLDVVRGPGYDGGAGNIDFGCALVTRTYIIIWF